jgi:hypothetical protein
MLHLCQEDVEHFAVVAAVVLPLHLVAVEGVFTVVDLGVPHERHLPVLEPSRSS